jgi:arginyl-tRNA synthetase
VKNKLAKLIVESLSELGLEPTDFVVEHPADLAHGDYSTNVALVLSKKVDQAPKELAEKIASTVEARLPQFVEKVEVAGPGFINFHLTRDFFKKSVEEIVESGDEFGKNNSLNGEKIIVEYTDPNPFKEFHIGHLMSNAIGEAVSRIIEWSGAEVKRACYQGDKGIHVAQAVWALKSGADPKIAYSTGAKAYKEDESAQKEIQEINKKIYLRSDDELNKIYDSGREASLKYFDQVYKKLGTKFDYFFFESDTGERGKKIVEENKGKIFEESDGAVVFKADEHNKNLHTRVFLSSEGLPTYEAKELGLAPTKFETYPYDRSIVITGNEVDQYFRVVLEAMQQVLPELRSKTEHLSHGMLRLPSGKMSSRTGDVITAEALIDEVKQSIESRGQIATDDIAVGAIKYMILRQSVGSDIIFDFEKSVSTDGDSGVYLQYSYARTNSLLEKAAAEGQTYSQTVDNFDRGQISVKGVRDIERLLYRLPEVIERAREGYAPNLITTYLTELASAYNNFYNNEQIISDEPEAPYRLAITKAFNTVMKNGLTVLGIPAPERM